jgi:hypothetical protein
MLLGRPWLKDAKVTHDWGNKVINIQGVGTVIIILINKKLGAKSLERLTNEEEDMIFETKLELFSIGTIIISNEIISLSSIGVSKIKINEKPCPNTRDIKSRSCKSGVFNNKNK